LEDDNEERLVLQNEMYMIKYIPSKGFWGLADFGMNVRG
jgi:hypothetical protein